MRDGDLVRHHLLSRVSKADNHEGTLHFKTMVVDLEIPLDLRRGEGAKAAQKSQVAIIKQQFIQRHPPRVGEKLWNATRRPFSADPSP
jgi:hypothetical protein